MNKRMLVPLVVVGILILAVLIGLSVSSSCPFSFCKSPLTAKEKSVTSYETCVAQGFLQLEGTPRQCRTTDGRTFNQPASMEASSAASSGKSQANITVIVPKNNEKVAKIFLVKGEARTFENTVNYRLKDSDGKVLIEAYTTANAPDVGQFGAYSATIDSSMAKGAKGTVEVYEASAKDGSEINKVSIPVVFTK